LSGAFSTEHYCNDIKPKRAVLYIEICEKITGGSDVFGFFGVGDGRLGRPEIFIRSGPALDKDDGADGSDHNQVDFTTAAGKVAGELF